LIRIFTGGVLFEYAAFHLFTARGNISKMLLSEFDYDLPEELIAQEPLADRSASRMLLVDRALGSFDDRRFRELPELVRSGDVFVINNTRVFPARLFGRSETGANVEIFLTEDRGEGVWEVLARPGRRLRSGKKIVFGGSLIAEVIEKSDRGTITIRFNRSGTELDRSIDSLGKTPLPPYIRRPAGSIDSDRERYQTVFADKRGAIAAPTAGLHFTSDLIARMEDAGAHICPVTLHVGYGTFEPVKNNDLSQHSVLPESYEISGAAADLLNHARSNGRRVIAIGTTTTRALESNLNTNAGIFRQAHASADLTIIPGYRFRAVDALLTNFHLPRSSLLVLVSTFGGHELIMKAYSHAVAECYRFYSYGDCMFVE
jgi:S-adenosylmethionine:tRNA ribosyltransferase-isomerase